MEGQFNFFQSAELLGSDFYNRHTVTVARELLGKLLCVRSNTKKRWEDPAAQVTVARILEVEAYRADDPASHSARGLTPRNAPMFGPPGHAYVYFIYGMYRMLNCVTEPEGEPGAVLIRAVLPIFGQELMRQRRSGQPRLADGPGRLCEAMGIQMAHNRVPLQGPEICLLDDGYLFGKIQSTSRIGIREGKDRLWRFLGE
jgi:DNA-3-methyladenine glycosylase